MFMSGRVAPAQTDAAADAIINARSRREEYDNIRCRGVSCISHPMFSLTEKSLPLEIVDFIHAEKFMSHDGQ
jgi:hypothetical protein